jgi:hypothetical protein
MSRTWPGLIEPGAVLAAVKHAGAPRKGAVAFGHA